MHIGCNPVQEHLPPWFLVLFHEFICKCKSVPPLYVNDRQNGSRLLNYIARWNIDNFRGCCSSVWGFCSKFTEFTWIFIYFLNICQSVNINSSWPYTANSRMKQLTQLFLHMFIEALLTTSCKASSQLAHMSWIHEFCQFCNFQSLLPNRNET